MTDPGSQSTPAPAHPRALAGRILEFTFMFGLLPVLLALHRVRAPLLPLLWTACLYCTWRLRRDGRLDAARLRIPRVPAGEWCRILGTFALALGPLLATVWLVRPGALFAFPLRHPLGWFLAMALYPPLSALPQEVVFRVFFFHRYQALFRSRTWLGVGSAVVFGLAHLAFHNWIAVALTIPGGLLFARTYRRGGGLLLVTLEHALYGCAVFTIGLGPFLAEGARHLPH